MFEQGQKFLAKGFIKNEVDYWIMNHKKKKKKKKNNEI